jgi:glycosyltransferase involved in cell wall biosynthesis
MRAKKILFFGKLPPPFTGENVISDSILKLLENNFNVTIINSAGSIEKKDGLIQKAIYYPYQALYMLKCFKRLKSILKKEKFDFIYFSGSPSVLGSLSDSVLTKIAKKNSGKIICHIHRGDYKNNFTARRLYSAGKDLVNRIDKFIFSSQSLSADLTDFIPALKRGYMFNPIDRNVLLTDEEFNSKHRLIPSKQKYIITYLSNFILSKGYMELVYAVKLLPEEIKNKIVVRFVGKWIDTDNEKQNFFSEIESKELSPIVEYIGPVADRKKIKSLLVESDIFCLPSYYPVEAQPVSIVEAMNAGNAIISTLHASIPEYVDDKKLGLLIEKRNTQQLANAIIAMCNVDVLSVYSLNARKKFQNNFSDAVITEKLNHIFN